ncbi:PASTA domain-containing protein [Actinocorallia populi]|uniref:PASTA domain-containing protein n=1 Tax=Actinocorallia populi TaxID=2079200 RepID=UPI000D08BC42|nr:PASTA domain-containing protein [Actinocorallia populi]
MSSTTTRGWQIPGYTELGELGSGAFGRVILAERREDREQVAVKYLSEPLVTDERFRSEFRAEARLLSGLDSRHVVRLREYVETLDGAAIVMDLVDGVSLRQLLDRSGATIPEAALAVLKGTLLGLADAHAAGVVHRDYKPENVLVSKAGVSTLVDFGIAVRSGSRPRAAGTPSYMPPELWENGAATPAGDIYSATAVFFECVTGRRPFRAPSIEALAVQHMKASIPDKDAPGPVRWLIRRGLAKDPVERPQSAVAFVEELQVVAEAAYGKDWERRALFFLASAVATALSTPEQNHTVPEIGGPGQISHVVTRLRASRPWRPPLPALPSRAVLGRTAGVILVGGVLAGGALVAVSRSESADRRPQPVPTYTSTDEVKPPSPAAPAAAPGRTATVPGVVGLGQITALQRIREAGLVARVEGAGSRRPPGTVIAASPRSGSRVPRGSTVTLTVAEAAPGEQVGVPPLQGLTYEEAVSALKTLKLVSAWTVKETDKVEQGLVLTTDPPAGKLLDQGGRVLLTIAKAPPPAKVKLPDLAGRPVEEAAAALRKLDLKVSRTPQKTREHPPGLVLSSTPGAGSTVTAGSTVSLVVSLEPDQVLVPDVTGLTPAEAAAALRRADLGVVRATRETSDVPEGRIVASTPAAGQPVDPGSRVTVHVARAPRVQVPSVRGLGWEEAARQLSAAGLEPVRHPVSSDLAEGTVLGTDPAAGVHVSPGSRVTVDVARPAPVTVPDLSGMSAERARAVLRDRGLAAQASGADCAGCTVGGQSPAAGAAVARGSAVTFTLVAPPSDKPTPRPEPEKPDPKPSDTPPATEPAG